jgi:hypothetical protein
VRILFGRHLAALGPITTLLLAASAVAQNLLPSSSNATQPTGLYASSQFDPAAASQPSNPPPQNSGNWWAGNAYDPGGGPDYLDAVCDGSPTHGVAIFVGYDTWRSISDGNWQNNGIHTGLNYGTRLGRFSDLTGIGFQIGGSVGAYNWSGTDYRLSHQDEAQPQGFITYGLFRRANENSNWNAAVVQDWMLNSNYGLFAANPTLSQWRGQVGYATNAFNEFGLWGAWRAMGDTRDVPGFGPVSWRSVNQISAFWHYKWGPGGADTSIWVGIPEHHRLTGDGSLGDYLVGLLANVPLSDRFLLYALITYMHPSAAPGPAGANEDAWNFSTGISFYPARNARTNTVAGQCWMPFLPVANNGYFVVDASQTYLSYSGTK